MASQPHSSHMAQRLSRPEPTGPQMATQRAHRAATELAPMVGVHMGSHSSSSSSSSSSSKEAMGLLVGATVGGVGGPRLTEATGPLGGMVAATGPAAGPPCETMLPRASCPSHL